MDDDWTSPRHVHLAFFLISLLLGCYLCFLVALPFLPSLSWAIALSVLATPLQSRLEKRFGHPNLCAIMSTCLIGLVVVIPASLAIQQLVLQASNGASLLEEKIESREWREDFSSHPRLATAIERLEERLDLPGNAKLLASSISQLTMSILRGSAYQLIDFGLTFYFLFFFLRDRELVLQSLCHLSPLTATQMDVLYRRVSDTINATVYGSFAVAALQGMSLGFTFWCIGLPAPLLWGLIMACLALAPVAGAIVVWAPAAVFLMLEGSWVKAIVLVFMGIFVIVVVDNLLRPILVGKRLKTHTLLVFISVVGGMLLFGPSGVLLGPIVLTVTQVLLALNHDRSIASVPANRN